MSLIFVYNADSGLFNTIADIGRKIVSPRTYSCRLCALTHGYFAMHREWQQFLESLDTECEFLHRDEFIERYHAGDVRLPAVFVVNDGSLSRCLDAAELDRCRDLDALKKLVRGRCGSGATARPGL